MPSEPSASAIRPTPVEILVLENLMQGYKDKEIALRIYRTENTVKTHIKRLIKLSRVRGRTDLAVMFVMWKYMGISNPYWDEPKDVYEQIGRGKNGSIPEG